MTEKCVEPYTDNISMKCPFREKDGEYRDCYGKNCMAYYELPFAPAYGMDEPKKCCMKLEVINR